MFQELSEAMDALYPQKRWGEVADEAAFGAGVGPGDGQALAAELSQELTASTFYRSGDADEYCDYIYVQCMGREPNLIQVRDGGVPLPEEFHGAPIEELYLRVCLSDLARLAGVQQVSVTLEPWEDGVLVIERPRGGVYDAPLLARLQRLVAILPAYHLTHLDFGDISSPPDGYDPGGFPAKYGELPCVANYLFFPQPITAETTTFLSPVSPAL